MMEFKFDLGEVAILTPIPGGVGPTVLVISQIKGLDGSVCYHVATAPDYGNGDIKRHMVAEYELQKLTA